MLDSKGGKEDDKFMYTAFTQSRFFLEFQMAV